jgi:hypothetical protein
MKKKKKKQSIIIEKNPHCYCIDNKGNKDYEQFIKERGCLCGCTGNEEEGENYQEYDERFI